MNGTNKRNGSLLFKESRIGNLRIKNKFVRSATWEGLAEKDGSVTEKLLGFYHPLASGHIGIILPGHAYVSSNGIASPYQIGIYSDKHIDGLSRLSSLLKSNGSTAILQISHGGCHSIQSEMRNITNKMDVVQIKRDFLNAALRVKKAGFDGIQIHAAHGYLLSQFLSSSYNKRTDIYGGSLINRFRLINQILESIKIELPDYPIFIKMNSQDYWPQGLEIHEAIEISKMLENSGVDCIEISGGTQIKNSRSPVPTGDIEDEREEAYYKESTKKIKKYVNIPVILVGGLRSYSAVNNLQKNKYADYFAFSRPFIAEPNLISRWKEGDLRRSKCISCNRCFKPAMAGKGIRCEHLRKKIE